MPFSFQLSDELILTQAKLSKRNPPLAAALNKKIKQIVLLNDENTIDHYKNLRHGLSDSKRVHIGSFVLLFRVKKKEKHILFDRFAHHDDIYSVGL